jgi:hypothetical protein
MLVPGVRDIVVEYTQTGEGVPDGGKTGRLSLRERTLDQRMFLPCANPACKKGGFLLRRKVDAQVESGEAHAELSLPCAGYLGPLRTTLRDAGEPPPRCPNKLTATVDVVRAKPR